MMLEGRFMKIIHIDIDTLRPDHLSCYGYKRETSPNIDDIAKKGIKFTNVFTSDSPCMPSRAATFSGTYGIKNGIITHGYESLRMKENTKTLVPILRRNGVHTYAFGSFGRHPAPWYYVDFEEIDDPLLAGHTHFQDTDGGITTEEVLKLLRTHRNEKNMYLHIHFWDPHTPYAAPLSFLNLIKNENYPEHPSEEEFYSHADEISYHSAKMQGINSYDEWKEVINEYDAEIRYTDYHVGRIIKEVQELDDDFLIIVMSDHGEEFGEHGPISEHWSVYNGTQRVPMILFGNNIDHRGDYDGLVYQFDIASTILDYFNIKVPEQWDSISLFDFLKGNVPPREYLVVGHGLYTAQRAVITKDLKLIRTYNSGFWDLPKFQLYAFNDFWEKDNLSDSNQKEVKRLEDILKNWERNNGKGEDPMMFYSDHDPAGISMYAKDEVEAYKRDGTLEDWKSPIRKPYQRLDY